METIRFKVTGTSPYLMHSARLMSQEDESGGLGVRRVPPPAEEARGGLYVTDGGVLYAPAAAFKSALVEAMRGRRIGKRSGTVVMGSNCFETLTECPLADPATGEPLHQYRIDIRRVVIRGRGGVRRARPRIDAWVCEVEFEYDPDFLTPRVLLEAMRLAGTQVGIGDYRPRPGGTGKGGPMGRFVAAVVACSDPGWADEVADRLSLTDEDEDDGDDGEGGGDAMARVQAHLSRIADGGLGGTERPQRRRARA